MRIYRSRRILEHHPQWRGRNAPPLPPKYQMVMAYPPSLTCINHLAVVGEGPGGDEDQAGFPFVGRSGEELDRFLDTYGIVPDECLITNLGRIFHYGNPDPSPQEISDYEPLLWEELNASKAVHYIAAVGRVSARYFLGDVDMEAVHGIPFGVVLPWLDNGRRGRVVVVPIYHPAAGFYSTEIQAHIAYDFAQLALAIEGRLTPRNPDTADLYPNPEYRDLTDLELDWIAGDLAGGTMEQPLVVGVDTEGLPGKPWGLSYSTQPGTARVIRKVHSVAMHCFYVRLLAGIKEGRIHVVLHNSLHDLRVLRELGIPIPDGSFTDSMVLAYHLCVEPQGLKPLAFRHCGMSMDSYDEIVQEAQDQIALEYYQTMEALGDEGFPRIEPYTVLERDKSTGQLKQRIKKPQQIHARVKRAIKDLAEGKTTAAGLRKRWNDTDEMVTSVVESTIGFMREADLDDVPLPRAVHYAARDADATVRLFPILWERHWAMGLSAVGKIDHATIPMIDRMQEVGIPVDRDYFIWLSGNLAERMVTIQQEIKQRWGVWINPNSGLQVSEVLFRPVEEGGLGLQSTKKTKGTLDTATGEMKGRRDSTVDKVLEGIRAKHPMVGLILDYRGLMKKKTSFADVVVRKAVMEAGLWVVHCLFRITRVSSGRLSATNPNLMAIINDDEIRIGYTAGDGYEFVEWDLDQVEMRVMASESGDQFLISMIISGEDIHTGTADKMFKLGLPRPYHKKQVDKEKHRDPAKRTGFGVITGIQAPGLVDQMRLQGIHVTEEEAAQWIVDWLAACPGVVEYMHSCHREAMAYGFVRDWAGRIRYLPGIHSPFGHVRAEAGRQTHSHKIQGGAQEIMKLGMGTIWRDVLPYWWAQGKYLVPIVQVHDSLMMRRRVSEWTKEESEELDAQVRASLFSAAPPGFKVPLGAGYGVAPTWGEMTH